LEIAIFVGTKPTLHTKCSAFLHFKNKRHSMIKMHACTHKHTREHTHALHLKKRILNIISVIFYEIIHINIFMKILFFQDSLMNKKLKSTVCHFSFQ